MAKISDVISSLLEIQAVIGDREVVLRPGNDCDIPLPDAQELGVNILDAPDFDVLFPLDKAEDLGNGHFRLGGDCNGRN